MAFWQLLFVTLAVASSAVVAEEFEIRSHLASMTPYSYGAGAGPRTPYTPPEGCQSLVSVDLVARHGSRFPTGQSSVRIAGLEALVAKYRSSIVPKWMLSWKSPFSRSDDGLLCERGAIEHRDIGERFAQRFGAVAVPYNANEVAVTCSASQRTSQSAAAFTVGAYGAFGSGSCDASSSLRTPVAVMSTSRALDFELRFFEPDNCPRYNEEVLKNPQSTAEYEAFMARIRPRIGKKLSDKTGIPIDEFVVPKQGFAFVETMWSACQSEADVNDDVAHFCSLFDPEDVILLEFADDLSSWWIKGYGFAIDWLIASPLLVDMVNNMDAAAKASPGTSYTRAKMRFGHAETILPFAALLGLFRDDVPLTANMTDVQIDARKWRFGVASPLAANIAFAQYRCNGESMVEMLFNEAVVPVPGCGGNRLCPLSTFKSIYSAVLTQDYNKLCNRSKK